MSPASLVGFALAFLLTAWVLSAVGGGAVLAAERRLARRGPRLERAAAALALATPPLLAAVVVAALLAHSAVAVSRGGDHCAAHLHHLHLCVRHGAAWAAEPWAVVTVVTLGTFVLGRTVQLVATQAAARVRLRRLERLAAEVRDDVVFVPSPNLFCFVAGLRRPRIYASTAAWDALDADGRRAVLAHERRHAARHDVARRLGLGWLALLGAPFVARTLLARWSSATERLCDREAADAIGDAATVAEALVTLARGAATLPAGVAPFTAAGDELTRRVDALLAPPPGDDGRARRWLRTAHGIIAVAAIAAAAAGDAMHHALETVLGVF